MKKLFSFITRLFSLRTAIIIIALVFATVMPRGGVIQWLDTTLFQLGTRLMPIQNQGSDILVVEAPVTEIDNISLRHEAIHANLLSLFNRRKESPTAVAVLVRQAPKPQDTSSEILLADVYSNYIKTLKPKEAKTQIAEYYQQMLKAKRWLKRANVFLGVDPEHAIGARWLAIDSIKDDTDTDSIIGSLPQVLMPKAASVGDSNWPADAKPFVSVSPANGMQSDLMQTLIWQKENQFLADISLLLYAKLSAQKEIKWLGKKVALSGETIHASRDGTIVPLFNNHFGKPFNVERVKLELLHEIDTSNKLVLVGETGDPRMDKIISTLVSLENKAYLSEPEWFFWANKLLLFFVVIYLIVLLPKMHFSTGVLVSALLLFGLAVSQLGWQVTQSQWLAMGNVMQLMLIGHLLMLVWRSRMMEFEQLTANHDQANAQLGEIYIREGNFTEAMKVLRHCRTSDKLLSTMYDLALQQERRRRYEDAIATLKVLVSRRKKYKDVTEKIQRLNALVQGTDGMLGEFDTAKTLVLPDSDHNKPVLGRYEVIRELGRGAMGIVYLGRDPKISRQVAIKTLNYNQFDDRQLVEVKSRFFREAEAAGRLSHPNIVTVYDVGEEHDLAFIAMDYVEGKSLSAYTMSENLLDVDKVYEIVEEVADALDYAHRQKIIHRDIKPGNILYDHNTGKVKVSDFGIARIIDDSKTRTGDILGSPLYMSPEQVQGQKITAATDIYSLGVTLYQLLTGNTPFTGDSLANLTYAIIHGKHKSIRELRSDLPSSATRITNKALQKNPEDRYANAADMAVALRKSYAKDFQQSNS